MTNLQKIQLIAKENYQGFTINVETLEPITSGFVVAMKETQNSFGVEGLKKCLEISQNTTQILGGWYNYENSEFYYDACIVVETEKEARLLALNNKQVTFFNLNTLEEIRLPQTMFGGIGRGVGYRIGR
jgi:hypothetical protein